MATCDICGGEIEFRYVDGCIRPIHLSGGCWGDIGDTPNRNISDLMKEDFCRKTRCPKCGEEPVYFIRHNGGSLWVDELGWPWTKHPCFDDKETRVAFNSLTHSLAPNQNPIIAIVSEVRLQSRPQPDILVALCDDRREFEFALPSMPAPEKLVGELIVISGRLNLIIHQSVNRYRVTLLNNRLERNDYENQS